MKRFIYYVRKINVAIWMAVINAVILEKKLDIKFSQIFSIL